MTRDEAKMVLELIRDRYSSVDVDRLSLTDAETDAINMAIEALERKRGEWINTRPSDMSDNIVCSECGYDSIADYLFCPNCGSDMRGEEDGNSDI